MRHTHTKPTGEKLAFTAAQLAQIENVCRGPRELALHRFLRDTCLRGVDALATTPNALLDSSGNVRVRFHSMQRKLSWTHETGSPKRKSSTLLCELEADTREAIAAILPMHKESLDAPLFPITTSWLRLTIKRWVEAIGLDPVYYAAHSYRRTLPTLMYHATKDAEACRQVLGHASLAWTSRYLSVTRDEALNVKRAVMQAARPSA